MATNEQIIGLIKTAEGQQRARRLYGTNKEGRRAAFILPDGPSPSAFAPDPDGANVDGASVARLIYQARLPSDPPGAPLKNNSRVGMWMSTVWDANTLTPTRKASHYSLYVLAKGFCESRDFPQEVSAVVAKAETAAGVQHGKTETSIFVAEHELGYSAEDAEGFGLLTEAGEAIQSEAGAALIGEGAIALPANGKLVVQQQVLVFRGPDIGWDAEPPEEIPGDLDEEGSVPDPQDRYFGYGTAFNNAGPTPGFAAGIVKARKPELGGSPWHHGFYVKKTAVDAYPFRFQKHWGVQAPGFDPGDGSGARPMSYMGLGTDLPDTPLHVQGPVPLEARLETTQDGAAPYTLGKFSFHGRTSFGVTPTAMAEWQVDVADPTHGAENAVVTLKNRYGGALTERLKIGQGIYDPGADLGDMGNGSLNFRAVYINGKLALGKDTTAPDVPTGLAAGTQATRTSAAGAQQITVPWSWIANTEEDLAGYVVALKRDGGGFRTFKVKENSFECQANAGEALQLKVLAHDRQHNVSAFCDPVTYTVTGDSAAPGAVSVTMAPAARPKGVLMKATAPADANFGGVAIYVNTVNNPGSATLLDFVHGRPNKTIKYRDDDAHTVGQTLWYWAASVNQDLVESATRTALGSVAYAGVKSADIEANQILLGTHLATAGGASVTDNDALNAKAHDARGYNRNPSFQRWSGAAPDQYTVVGAPTVSKATSSPRYGEWGLQVACAAASNQWLQTTASSQGELRIPPSADDYYVVEYEVTLVSGDFKRAGAWWKVQYQDGSNLKGFRLNLFDEHPSPTVGKVYSGAKVLANDSAIGTPTGLPTDAQLYLMSNWSSLTGGADSAKTLIWHRVSVRKATRQEIRAEKALDDNGDLTRDLTAARKISSQIMTHAAGGTYTGELAATVGATLGTNLKTSGGATVGDHDALNSKAHDVRGYNRQPTFQRWTGSLPDNWTSTGATVTKQTTSPRYGDWSLEVAYPASDNQYLFASGGEVRTPPSADDYYVVEYEVELVSGDFSRAGIWWRVDYQDSANYKHFTLDLTIEHPGAATGKVYAGAKAVPAALTGSPTGVPSAATLFLIGNHSLMGDTVTAKTLRWHRVSVRKASKEEIKSATLGALASKNSVGSGDIDSGAVSTAHIVADAITKPDFNSAGADAAMSTNGGSTRYCQFDISNSASSGSNGLILAAGQIDADNTGAGEAYVGVFVDDTATFADATNFRSRALFWQHVYVGQGQSAPFSISVYRSFASGAGVARNLSLRGIKVAGNLTVKGVSTLTFINFKR